ncbi:MAG TPA: hypothetical protein VF057_05940 [Thermoanaerobaculia bacterium]
MAKKTGKQGAVSLLQRAASSLARALTRRSGRSADEAPARTKARGGNGSAAQRKTRTTRREPDIPLDTIASTYTPTQTSLKGPFRTSGADRQRDQEFNGGFADDRWNDEDHYTNKSGDPRIGTHGRSYEPGERKP